MRLSSQFEIIILGLVLVFNSTIYADEESNSSVFSKEDFQSKIFLKYQKGSLALSHAEESVNSNLFAKDQDVLIIYPI